MNAPRNGRVALRLTGVVALMLGASFAAVPFYDWFCRVTGYGGTTMVAEAPTDPARPEMVTIRFDANREPGMPWEFRPLQRTMKVHVGESALAFYEAYNPTDEPVAGTAGYNVAPHPAGPFFAKIACFCFELQVLQPGERITMPVSFFVDPEMLADRDAQGIGTITLSYTMHRSPLPETASLDVGAGTAAAHGSASTEGGKPTIIATASVPRLLNGN